ncbi:hypothetical protein BC938DRAFT_474354 [Jimgerdemannia flammicorona]|uniref:Uncharacterized protein n=1 Tax=Jimgerdemannia flammicorona TaxID=994334 RepID=A0A433Q2E0_9FUNG|nr:hypothetical protein BC938DRAFT_474354 [Jimgerdemannia flammicorona]
MPLPRHPTRERGHDARHGKPSRGPGATKVLHQGILRRPCHVLRLPYLPPTPTETLWRRMEKAGRAGRRLWWVIIQFCPCRSLRVVPLINFRNLVPIHSRSLGRIPRLPRLENLKSYEAEWVAIRY